MKKKETDITNKEKDFLDSLVEFINEKRYTPTIREMGEFVGLSSPATIHYYIKQLQNKGYIRRINNRNIQILNKGEK